MSYCVVMFNNRNKVIDSIELSERIGDLPRTRDLLLHHKTSYIALILKGVNEEDVETKKYMYYSVVDLVVYTLLVSVFSFAFIWLCAFIANAFIEMVFSSKTVLLDYIPQYIPGGIFVGLVCMVLFILNGGKNGITVSLNGRK